MAYTASQMLERGVSGLAGLFRNPDKAAARAESAEIARRAEALIEAQRGAVSRELAMEKPYARLQARMDEAEARCGNGEPLSESIVRSLWAGSFDNASNRKEGECRALLGRALDNAVKMGGEKALNWYERDAWDFGGRMPGSYRPLYDASQSPLTVFGPGEAVVVVNMVGGFTVAPIVFEALRKLGREPAGVAFVGWSKNGQTRLPSGEEMKESFYIPPADLEYLEANAGKACLIVDDCSYSGKSLRRISDNLKAMGVRRVYATVGLRVADMDSPSASDRLCSERYR